MRAYDCTVRYQAARSRARSWSRRITDPIKRALDFGCAVLLLIATSPLLACCILVVLAMMGRPVLFLDERAGRGGAAFGLLKFRTMRPLRAGEQIPESDRDRITPIGRFLRATSLDELPSLWNVVRGQMSLVGPRPLPTRYVDRYSGRQARRLEVRPGITGWAQVRGRNSIGWDDRLALDVWYVEHRSLHLDVWILLLTLVALLRREGIAHEGHATMPEFSGDARPIANRHEGSTSPA